MKKKKGFTLVENVSALACFMIVMVAITTVLISSIKVNGANRKTYNSDIMSKTFFECIRETRPTKLSVPESISKQYKISFNNSNEIKEATKKLFKGELSTVTNAKDYEECKDTNNKYSMGIILTWKAEGFYEVETCCWNNAQGEASLVKRETYVTPNS